MTRVQVYLDPKHLDILDLLAAQAGTSRSQAIRDVVETAQSKIVPKTQHPLIQMAGFIKNAPKDLASNVDDIYLRDQP